MDGPKLFGADDSAYVRIARLTLQEKGVDYDLVPIDVFAAEGPPLSYMERHPFGKIPSFEHDGFGLYETGAITRYIDEAFEGPELQPSEVKKRARVNQMISIADGYLYPQLVWGMYVELVFKLQSGEPCDVDRVAEARLKAPTCLKVLSDFIGEAPWLGGDCLSLADLYVAPMIDYFLMVPAGQDLLLKYPNLAEWWRRMNDRPSMQTTRPREH